VGRGRLFIELGKATKSHLFGGTALAPRKASRFLGLTFGCEFAPICPLLRSAAMERFPGSPADDDVARARR
jgi:hypothetical protein